MTITDEMLYEAAPRAAELFLGTLPGREDCGHVFSPQFRRSMEPLLRSNRRRRPWLRWTAAVILALVLLFSAAVTANAQFRQWVIQLFSVSGTEQVPAPEQAPEDGEIRRYAADAVGDIFTAEYLESDAYLDTWGSLFYRSDETGTAFFRAENGAFQPVPSFRLRREVSLLGLTGEIDYTCCIYEGHQYFQQEELFRNTTESGEEYAFYLLDWDGQAVLQLMRGRQMDVWEYPALYDVETGAVTDILAGVIVDGTALRDMPVLNGWEALGGDLYTVRLGQSAGESTVYLVDAARKTAVSFRDLTGLTEPISAVKAAEGRYMLYIPWEDGGFSYYRYDPSSGQCACLYDHAAYWRSGSGGPDTTLVSFTGGRYDFVKAGGEIWLTDELTGGRMSVEGLTEEMAQSALINADGDRLLVSVFSEDGIGQIGVIDIPRRTFYLLDRESAPGSHEYSVCWHGDAVQIQARDETCQSYYIYRYTLR